MTELFDKKELEQIGTGLLGRKETIAVAESVTSGLLQFAFSNIPNGIKLYQGGITAYNVGQKYKHLGVEPIHAVETNCVSQQIADQMAMQVCRQFGSHWGISITGYATPVPESDNQVFAYYAIVYNNTVVDGGRIAAKEKAPPDLQLDYVNFLLGRLLANLG
jgi:nicotinamide-nucleotide amidase